MERLRCPCCGFVVLADRYQPAEPYRLEARASFRGRGRGKAPEWTWREITAEERSLLSEAVDRARGTLRGE